MLLIQFMSYVITISMWYIGRSWSFIFSNTITHIKNRQIPFLYFRTPNCNFYLTIFLRRTTTDYRDLVATSHCSNDEGKWRFKNRSFFKNEFKRIHWQMQVRMKICDSVGNQIELWMQKNAWLITKTYNDMWNRVVYDVQRCSTYES